MLHQYQKSKMITRSQIGTYFNEVEVFLANAEMAAKNSQRAILLVQECIQRVHEGGSKDVAKAKIASVCADHLTYLNVLIQKGDTLVEQEKGFENPFSLIGGVDRIRQLAHDIEEVIRDTREPEIDSDVAAGDERLAKRFKFS